MPSKPTPVPRSAGMSDQELTEAAINAVASTPAEFARITGAGVGSLSRRRTGESQLTEEHRRWYRVLIDHPHVARWLAETD